MLRATRTSELCNDMGHHFHGSLNKRLLPRISSRTQNAKMNGILELCKAVVLELIESSVVILLLLSLVIL